MYPYIYIRAPIKGTCMYIQIKDRKLDGVAELVSDPTII